MDESNLPFKQIPSRTLAPKSRSEVSSVKKQMEKFTFAGCSNADGSLKLPVIVIGKSKNPRCLKNSMNQLPVWYRNQKSAFMERTIFEEWFRNEFVPRVESFLISIGLPPIAILLVDNCKAHKFLKVREIEVTFFPPNVTSLVQPMDQGILQATKLKYQKKFVNSIIEAESQKCSLINHLKTVNIKMAIDWVAEAWKEVLPSTIYKCWNVIWPITKQSVGTQTDHTSDDFFNLSDSIGVESVDTPESSNCNDIRSLVNVIKKIDGYQFIQSAHVSNWLRETQQETRK